MGAVAHRVRQARSHRDVRRNERAHPHDGRAQAVLESVDDSRLHHGERRRVRGDHGCVQQRSPKGRRRQGVSVGARARCAAAPRERRAVRQNRSEHRLTSPRATTRGTVALERLPLGSLKFLARCNARREQTVSSYQLRVAPYIRNRKEQSACIPARRAREPKPVGAMWTPCESETSARPLD